MKGSIRYKVTVTSVVEFVDKNHKSWEILGQEFKDGHPDKPVNVMGYTPVTEKIVLKDVALFEQTVDDLDMAALVLIVNGIDPWVPT